METGNKRCAVIMANDAYAVWALRFFRSFREHNPDTELFVIPYADDMEIIAKNQSRYAYKIYQGNLSHLEDFAAGIFPSEPYKRKRLRKLAVFDLPCDEFLYVDTDVVVLDKLDPWYGHINAGGIDLVYMAKSSDFVYKPGYEKVVAARMGASGLFSSGAFVSSPHVFSSGEIVSVVMENLASYLRYRADFVFDQPVINYAFDISRKNCVHIHQISDQVTGAVFFKDASLVVREGAVSLRGSERKVLAVHWAGSDKNEGQALNALIQRYSTEA
jgi:hypothetical protein